MSLRKRIEYIDRQLRATMQTVSRLQSELDKIQFGGDRFKVLPSEAGALELNPEYLEYTLVCNGGISFSGRHIFPYVSLNPGDTLSQTIHFDFVKEEEEET